MDSPRFLAAPHLIASLANDLERLQTADPSLIDDLSAAPTLFDWGLTPVASFCLSGSVTGHPVLGSSLAIHTSPLFAIGEDGTWARTLSRFYRLRRRAGTSIEN